MITVDSDGRDVFSTSAEYQIIEELQAAFLTMRTASCHLRVDITTQDDVNNQFKKLLERPAIPARSSLGAL